MYITNLQSLLPKFKIEVIIQAYYPKWKEKTKLPCPFHEEKTPSFSISKIKNLATCFGGCGSHNPVAFVQRQDACTFVEAVVKCAQLHNLEVQQENKKRSPEEIARQSKKQEKTLQLVTTNDLVAKAYFNNCFGKGTPTSFDFKNDAQVRSLTKTTIDKFGICTTSEDWSFLGKKFDTNVLLELGLIRKKKNGGYYDAFRNKQLFPIHGKNNQIAGFAGRQLITDSQYPKYTNSPESTIYKKSQLLYGLYPQANYIQKHGMVYLAEGYWDVLTPYDKGFKGIVATCGTALSVKQAKLIKRFTKRVCYLADNDSNKEKNAGLEAVKKGLPILLKEGLQVYLVIFPEGHDPDSFIRSIGAEAFAQYVDASQKDAFLWSIEEAWYSSTKDGFAQAEIKENAINILVTIDNETVLDYYCKQIAKIIGVGLNTFRIQLRDAQEKHLEGNSTDVSWGGYTTEQQKSVTRYRLFEKGNRTYCTTQQGHDVEVANFIVNPLFHLSSKENPKRLFEIVNEVQQRRIIDTETTNLVTLDRFKQTVEAAGNFVFMGDSNQYVRLKRKIYDMMQTCYEIDTLGYHKDGFYVFGNGIYTPNNEFIEVDKYGVVEFNKKQYFLPAFSDIYKGSEMLYDEEKNFVYKPSKITFEVWAKLFCQVHGNNGKIALCFYIVALFRSEIQKTVKVPLLNLFGQPATGKSLLAENLICMFFKKAKGFNIHAGTKVALFNKLMVARDALTLLEEYKNAIAHSKVEACKSIYDNIGRERGQKTSSKNQTTPIYSAALLVGQELPTADVALFTRCISLAFSKTDYSQKEKERADKLKAIRGNLTHITAQLSTFRGAIKEHFSDHYKEQYKELRIICESENISARMIENNAILLAVFECLKDKIKFPFSGIDFFSTCTDNLFRQSAQISKENEVSIFWSLVEFLAQSHFLSEGSDYLIKPSKTDPSKRLLYVHFAKTHPLYLTYHKQQHGKQGLTKSSLQHYLKSHHTFVKTLKSCRFGRKNTSAFVFDYDKLGISITNEPERKTDDEIFEEAAKNLAKINNKNTPSKTKRTQP